MHVYMCPASPFLLCIQDNATPLFAASQCGHVDCVKLLLGSEAVNTELAMQVRAFVKIWDHRDR